MSTFSPLLVTAMPLEHASILLLDRDDDYVDVLKLLLRMEGACVHAVSAAAAAVRSIGMDPPNVFLGDPDLADVRVHMALHLAAVPHVLKLATWSDPSVLSVAVLGQYDDFVRKPLDIEALIRRIGEWAAQGDVNE
jgi:DNA-binding NtrC family response regulator